jgi:hypothetical protein
MKSAVRLLLVAALLAGITGVSAQTLFVSPTGKDRPPVSVSGWRYEQVPNDVHMFLCEQASCIPGSKVSYRFYAAGDPMTLEGFRKGQEEIVKVLEQQTPGKRITVLGVEGSGTAVPRMFKARRKVVAADGTSEYVVSGRVFGSKAGASVISTSRDEKTSNANYALFGVAVMLFVAPTKK